MASSTAMAKCLRADAKLMIGNDAVLLDRAERLSSSIVRSTSEYLAANGHGQSLAKVALMLAAAAALEAE